VINNVSKYSMLRWEVRRRGDRQTDLQVRDGHARLWLANQSYRKGTNCFHFLYLAISYSPATSAIAATTPPAPKQYFAECSRRLQNQTRAIRLRRNRGDWMRDKGRPSKGFPVKKTTRTQPQGKFNIPNAECLRIRTLHSSAGLERKFADV
jgi:hypothetical protein